MQTRMVFRVVTRKTCRGKAHPALRFKWFHTVFCEPRRAFPRPAFLSTHRRTYPWGRARLHGRGLLLMHGHGRLWDNTQSTFCFEKFKIPWISRYFWFRVNIACGTWAGISLICLIELYMACCLHRFCGPEWGDSAMIFTSDAFTYVDD